MVPSKESFVCGWSSGGEAGWLSSPALDTRVWITWAGRLGVDPPVTHTRGVRFWWGPGKFYNTDLIFIRVCFFSSATPNPLCFPLTLDSSHLKQVQVWADSRPRPSMGSSLSYKSIKHGTRSSVALKPKTWLERILCYGRFVIILNVIMDIKSVSWVTGWCFVDPTIHAALLPKQTLLHHSNNTLTIITMAADSFVT